LKDSNIEKEYTVGRKIHWTGWTSTSRDISRAKNFAGSCGIIFVIRVSYGKLLGNYSVFPKEMEILLFPNSCFLVLSVEKKRRIALC